MQKLHRAVFHEAEPGDDAQNGQEARRPVARNSHASSSFLSVRACDNMRMPF
jgi:hypothetical protein